MALTMLHSRYVAGLYGTRLGEDPDLHAIPHIRTNVCEREAESD